MYDNYLRFGLELDRVAGSIFARGAYIFFTGTVVLHFSQQCISYNLHTYMFWRTTPHQCCLANFISIGACDTTRDTAHSDIAFRSTIPKAYLRY